MLKWLVKNDREEIARVMLRTNSRVLSTGELVKILDSGILATKVRVIKTDQECWTTPEAVR
jgi:hypothetical protein